MAFFLRSLALLIAFSGAGAVHEDAVSAVEANPIRRVVTMLQMMQKKVAAEGKEEEELFLKFMCYCKTGTGDLTKSISAAESKVPQLTSALAEAESLKEQLEKQLDQHKADSAEANDAVAKATGLREKEASTFAKESSDSKTNIASLGKAITAIETGMSGSFLQSTTAVALQRLTISMEMSSVDRDLLSAFLSHGTEYVPQSGQITGILKQMKETMEKDLAEITATEEASIKDFESLVAAKEKEIEANTQAIESKLERVGQVGIEIVEMKEDLEDTSKGLLQDKQFLADLEKGCKTKEAEWAERSKTRAEELIAIGDTIKILNDDDALDLFKKTLPGASLLQTKVTNAEVKRRAVTILTAARHGHRDPRLDFISLALRGRTGGSFDKVVKMIDDMVALLGKEQIADDEKKAYCEAELDKAEDEKKGLERTVSDLEKALEEAKSTIGTLTEEIKALIEGITDLDKQVAVATENRKEENQEYKDALAANSAAKQLLELAKNRLAKFYTPETYKAPPKKELSEEERIAVNMGSEPEPTLVEVSAHIVAASVAAPGPPPETWGAYQTKGQEQGGVVAMLNILMTDLDKEIRESDVEEKNTQAEYETFIADSAAKRTEDSKTLADKESAKADLESEITKMDDEHKSTMKEAMAKAEFIHDLHLECDWLVTNYEVRKEARAGEVDALKKAKAVLAGADYSLVQTAIAGRAHLRGSL